VVECKITSFGDNFLNGCVHAVRYIASGALQTKAINSRKQFCRVSLIKPEFNNLEHNANHKCVSAASKVPRTAAWSTTRSGVGHRSWFFRSDHSRQPPPFSNSINTPFRTRRCNFPSYRGRYLGILPVLLLQFGEASGYSFLFVRRCVLATVTSRASKVATSSRL
jgi:hypothetical protein